MFTRSEYDDYVAKINGEARNPNAIDEASVEGVRREGGRTVTLVGGTYHFVVDNTDIGDAGDWGSEATREVTVDLETKGA